MADAALVRIDPLETAILRDDLLVVTQAIAEFHRRFPMQAPLRDTSRTWLSTTIESTARNLGWRRSIAALAREHGVSRGAIRTAVAGLMPEHTAAGREDAPAPELSATLDMPGKIADFLRTAELESAERAALDHGVTVRRGQGYTLRVSTTPAVHRQFLARCHPLDGVQGVPAVPARRKARREYEN
ncbi:hypothetical protein ACFVT2_39925 [Streptomyces sp. NPDC058000]|uniref:hypothetical protein n=1 Tax=Streptomyces sp. NPDC058000 TaxID=3346299 RepID=UPI0036E9DFF9